MRTARINNVQSSTVSAAVMFLVTTEDVKTRGVLLVALFVKQSERVTSVKRAALPLMVPASAVALVLTVAFVRLTA